MDRIKNHTGTIHWTTDGVRPACGPVATHRSWFTGTVERVTCERCLKLQLDTTDAIDVPVLTERDILIATRTAERAARQAARAAGGTT